MATNDRNDLMLDILKRIQGDLAKNTHAVSEMKATLGDLRMEMHSLYGLVHSLRGEHIRTDHAITALQMDVDRIKTRLDLSDA